MVEEDGPALRHGTEAYGMEDGFSAGGSGHPDDIPVLRLSGAHPARRCVFFLRTMPRSPSVTVADIASIST